MKRPIAEHTEHYAVLALILGTGLLGIAWFNYSPTLQQLVLWTVAGLYVLWGIIHHLIRKDLTLLVVAEYLLMALLGAGLIQAVLFNR